MVNHYVLSYMQKKAKEVIDREERLAGSHWGDDLKSRGVDYNT